MPPGIFGDETGSPSAATGPIEAASRRCRTLLPALKRLDQEPLLDVELES
jgi:hypothetical protein